jgi:predicted GNAT superfamily acetyltransferase
MYDGDFEIADRIITAIANNYASEPSYYETARLYRLYTEIFYDRGAYMF